jgi:hypothetical protein
LAISRAIIPPAPNKRATHQQIVRQDNLRLYGEKFSTANLSSLAAHALLPVAGNVCASRTETNRVLETLIEQRKELFQNRVV